MGLITDSELEMLKTEVANLVARSPAAAAHLYSERWKLGVLTVLSDLAEREEVDMKAAAKDSGIENIDDVLTGQATLEETLVVTARILDSLGHNFRLSTTRTDSSEESSWDV